MTITVKKGRMIKQIIESGNVWKSAYFYTLNESGEIEKVHFGSSKREVWATAEEVAAIRRNMEIQREQEARFIAEGGK